MLMFHDGRMGLVSTGVCRAPLWAAPAPHWFAPSRPPAMERAEDVRSVPPSSPQSDSDSSHSAASEWRAYYGDYGYHVTAADQPQALECRWRACAERLPSLDALSSHVASTHADVTGGLFYCGWEGCARGHRGFNARYKMLVHVRTHTNERPHKCTQCDKSFSRAENLKIHTRSHSGEKPYVCPVQGCNKAYSNSSDRFKHTRTHSVDKPYCCKIAGCQKRYTDPSSLRKHVKTYKHTSPTLPQPEYKPDLPSQLETARTTIHPNMSLSESDTYDTRLKHHQRKYSYSENDKLAAENTFKIECRSQTPMSLPDSQDESDKLCFCKDLPCVHTSRYVDPEYISMDSLPYTCRATSTQIPYKRKLSTDQEAIPNDNFFSSEPLNLKRINDSRFEEIYENGVLNLEKKAKTAFTEISLDSPLDLSKKTL